MFGRKRFMGLWGDFQKLLKNLQPVPFDPTSLGDDFAVNIEWTPVRGGGSNFVTARLMMMDNGLYAFRMSSFAKIFWMGFGLVGLASIGGGIYVGLMQELDISMLAFVTFPFVFLGLSGYMLYQGLRRGYVIDPFMKIISQGVARSVDFGLNPIDASGIKFADVYALQIIKERVRSKSSSYFSYELNLILKDKERVNLLDHGKYNLVREDADMLASVLGVPLWDAVAVDVT